MTPELAVALGAACGAPARYLLDLAVRRSGDLSLPLGIVLVNLLGSAAAGVLVGLSAPDRVTQLVGVGFLGSFTTASTLAWDVLTQRTRRAGALLLVLHVVPGLLLAALGLVLGRAL